MLIGNGYAQQRGGWYAATGPSTDVFEWFLSLTCYSCSCLLSADQHLLWKQVVSELLAPKKGSVRTSGIALLFSKIRPAPYSFLYLSCPLLLFSPGLSMDFMRKALRECFFFCLYDEQRRSHHLLWLWIPVLWNSDSFNFTTKIWPSLIKWIIFSVEISIETYMFINTNVTFCLNIYWQAKVHWW